MSDNDLDLQQQVDDPLYPGSDPHAALSTVTLDSEVDLATLLPADQPEMLPTASTVPGISAVYLPDMMAADKITISKFTGLSTEDPIRFLDSFESYSLLYNLDGDKARKLAAFHLRLSGQL